EPLETRRRNDTHQATGSLAEISISVRDAARRKNGRAFFGGNALAAYHEFIVAFQDLERLIFAMMHVRGRAAIRHVVRFNRADNSAGVAAVNANDHGNAEDIDLLTSINRDLNWRHRIILTKRKASGKSSGAETASSPCL